MPLSPQVAEAKFKARAAIQQATEIRLRPKDPDKSEFDEISDAHSAFKRSMGAISMMTDSFRQGQVDFSEVLAGLRIAQGQLEEVSADSILEQDRLEAGQKLTAAISEVESFLGAGAATP